MFIKSKFGLFNTDNIECFSVSGGATIYFCVSSNVPKLVSNSDVMDKIAAALKNGDIILEVE